jgi:hypothetical protein
MEKIIQIDWLRKFPLSSLDGAQIITYCSTDSSFASPERGKVDHGNKKHIKKRPWALALILGHRF